MFKIISVLKALCFSVTILTFLKVGFFFLGAKSLILRVCTRVGPLREVLSLVFRVRRQLGWACVVAEDLCCSPAICLLCVLTLGVTPVTVAWKLPRELYRNQSHGTHENAASSFTAHLRGNHFSALGNSVILGRELLPVQPVGQRQIRFTRPLCTYYGICMNDDFSGHALTCWGHPKGEGGHVAVPQNTLPGAAGPTHCQTHRSSLRLACGGCDSEVTEGTWWSS